MRSILYAVLITLACFTVYSNGYDQAFKLDSGHVIVKNPYVRSLSHIPEYFTNPGTFTMLRSNVDYRPVLQISYAVDYWMGGV